MASIDSLDDLVDAISGGARSHAHTALATAELEQAQAWALDGWVSMRAWMQHHGRLSIADANRLLGDGRFLRRYPAVADAMLSGQLSISQLAVLRRAVTAPLEELFDDHQHAVVDAITPLNMADTITVCTAWRELGEAVADIPPPDVPEQLWKASKLDDGTMVGNFVFNMVTAGELRRALDIARTEQPDDTRTRAEIDADAVASIISFFLANHDRPGTPRQRPHVELHNDVRWPGNPNGNPDDVVPDGPEHDPTRLFELTHGASGCVVTDSGQLLPQWAAQAYMCDCVLHRVLRAGATVLDYGRATYDVPLNLFRAVAARDGGCRFPGCTRPVAWTHAHHIQEWERDGDTKLDNLMLLCAHHHRLVHRQHWRVVLRTDATAEFTRPGGRTLLSEPRGSPTRRTPVAA